MGAQMRRYRKRVEYRPRVAAAELAAVLRATGAVVVEGPRACGKNVGRVLRSLARHVGTQASARSIAAYVGGAEGPVDHHTVLAYLVALTRVFVGRVRGQAWPRCRGRGRPLAAAAGRAR